MRENVDPKTWGPPAWTFLESCAKACDEASAQSYRDFLGLLPDVLPCEQCRVHSAEYISKNPVDTDNLTDWIRRFKRAVASQKARATTPQKQSLPCSACGGPKGVARVTLIIIGSVVAIAALVLLIIGLVKLTKAH
jgi:hypothetical protein